MATLVSEEIHLVDITKELKRLENEELSKKKSRASFFTLVVYTEKQTRDSTYSSLIHPVIAKFPCRIILITNNEGSRNYLRTHVSTTDIAQGHFCDMIEIEASGDLKKRIPYIVLPHILTDLPLHLVWTVDPSSELTILPQLEPLATKIIFAPKSKIDIQKFCQNIFYLRDTLSSEVCDLNWSAIKGFREIFAHIFDTKERFDVLRSLKLLRISYTKTASTFSSQCEQRAIYFQGWLSSTLGWKFKSLENVDNTLKITYEAEEKQRVVLLTGIDDPLNKSPSLPGTILSVDLECALEKTRIVFKRNSKTRQIFIHYADQEKCLLPTCSYLPGLKEGQEVVEEIFYGRPSWQYRNMVEMCGQIPWQ